MAAGCTIAQDTSTNHQLIDGELEGGGKFKNIDGLGFEETSNKELLSSEDSALDISSNENYLSENLQLYLRLNSKEKEAFHILPSEEEVLAEGGDLYTWKYDDLKHCPILRKTVSNTITMLEAEDTSCNKKKSSKPSVKKKSGQMSTQTVRSVPPLQYSTGRVAEISQHTLDSVTCVHSSGYWSIGSPKSDAQDVRKDLEEHAKSCSLNDEKCMIVRMVPDPNSCSNHLADAHSGKMPISNQASNQTVKNVAKFQNSFHSKSGRDLKEPSRDSLEQNSSDQNQQLTSIADYKNQFTPLYHDSLVFPSIDEPEDVFRPLKSASSAPTLTSKSSLDNITHSHSNCSLATLRFFLNPPAQSLPGSIFLNAKRHTCEEAVNEAHSIEFVPLEDSKSQISFTDCMDIPHNVDAPHGVNDTSSNNFQQLHEERPMITIGRPQKTASPAQVSPPSEGSSDDSLSETLSPGLKKFLRSKPSLNHHNFKEVGKCLHQASSSQSNLSNIVSPPLKGFLSNNLKNNNNSINQILVNSTQQPIAGMPRDIHSLCAQESNNTPVLRNTEVNDVSPSANSMFNLSSTKDRYSPWTHVVMENRNLPPKQSSLKVPTIKNKATRNVNVPSNSQANIAGVRYEGRLKIPGVIINDGLPFKKMTTYEKRNQPEVAGASVLTPQLPIAGFNCGSDVTASSTTTDSGGCSLVPYDNSSLVSYENSSLAPYDSSLVPYDIISSSVDNANSSTISEIGRSTARERMVQGSINVNLSDITLSVNESLQDDKGRTADGSSDMVDCVLTLDSDSDIGEALILNIPPPSLAATPVTSASSLEQAYCFKLKLRGEFYSQQFKNVFQRIFQCCKRRRT